MAPPPGNTTAKETTTLTSLLRIQAGRPVAGGYLLCRSPDGAALLLSGALPGETVDASVTAEGKGYRTARTERVVEPSPERVEPPCPLFGRCGGCTLQHAPYPLQLRMKAEALADTLRRVGGVGGGEPPVAHPSPLPWRYRRRCRVQLRKGKAGFLAAGSHEVVATDRCPLLSEPLERLLPALAELPRRPGAQEAHLLTDGDRSLAYLPGRKSDPGVVRLLASGGCSGVRFDDRAEGEGFLVLPVAGIPLRASAGAFLQANREANDLLVGRLRELAAAEPPVGRLLDLYAGGGNFALPLSDLAGEVTAVESGGDSFRDLQANRDALAIRNCRLVQAPVEAYRPEPGTDLAVVDPPRAGLSPGARRTLLAAAPGKILYVSCDPATLARDLGALAARYEVALLEMFDFFPQGHHVETLALLRRRAG